MIKAFCAQHPQPKKADIETLCVQFKSKSNGEKIWPKLPSMIKPAIEIWKINQRIELLKLQSGRSYSALIEWLKSKTITLLPPPRRLPPKQITRQQMQSSSETAPPQRLPHPHVPPLCAPTQSTFVPSSASALQVQGGKCAWWPVCQDNWLQCGGKTKDLCANYGRSGKKQPPSEAECNYQFQVHTWSDAMKARDCSWYPYCRSKQYVCGGKTRKGCSIYGTNGTHSHEAPSEEQLKKAKARAKAQKEMNRRESRASRS